jgi:hypothetical protein
MIKTLINSSNSHLWYNKEIILSTIPNLVHQISYKMNIKVQQVKTNIANKWMITWMIHNK